MGKLVHCCHELIWVCKVVKGSFSSVLACKHPLHDACSCNAFRITEFDECSVRGV